MDIQQIGMVYYKDFIDVISGKGTPVTSEKFDWAEQAMNRLKNWYKTS